MILPFLLMALFVLFSNYTLSDGDTFFHIKVGEYISKNGFPTKDPFSFHDLSYTPHEWLSDFIFYKIFNCFGYLGLAVFLCLLMSILIFILYKTINLLNGKTNYLSFTLAFGSAYILDIFNFVVVRPHFFSFIISVLQIYFLEAYLRSERKLCLAIIPFLSLLLANLHIGTFPLFLVLFLPYLADNLFKINKEKIYSEGNIKHFRLILLTMLGSIVASFINPYGIKKLLYFSIIFNSDTQTVIEWSSPSFKGFQGIIIFSTFLIGLCLMIFCKSRLRVKNILLYFGLMFMALYSIRFYSYFILVTGPILGETIYENYKVNPIKLFTGKAKEVFFSFAMITVVLVSIFFKFSYNFEAVNFENFPENAVKYLKENTSYNNIRLYNDYIYGGYIMLNGIKVFIDSRQDLYLDVYNSNCEVYSDYLNLTRGKVHYKDILKKYNFEYLIITKNTLLENYLSFDKEYIQILSDKDSVLYKKIEWAKD
ncbi:MAG: hypothetical protein GX270_07965 [Clostridiaceae bacterium]|nr:hypothetical protein [Clostridiaceae bacterium]